MTIKDFMVAIGDLPAWALLLVPCWPAVLIGIELAAQILFWLIGEFALAAFALGRRNAGEKGEAQ
ncbi:hypothetical protein [Sphingobium yanoikuyae]|uniref:Uncharacterized protein n=1 Tax=Sphingobium yanoikuyae TaxID=13690 RepID=A0A430BZ96_SPHYA|nr:hypothetical protein [Sphingobium yanoikuyae]RSU58026.1 hypothetical protein DAH51_07220 [Sphingobium yanoikuyae]